MQKPKVSVLIASRDRENQCIELIKDIKQNNTISMEFIVVDDASKVHYNKKNFPNTQIIQNKSNLKLPRSRNKSIKKARGKYIFITDDDVKLITPELITKSAMILEKDEKISAVFPLKIDASGKTRNELSCFKTRWYSGNLVKAKSVRGNINFGGMTYLVRTDLLKKVLYDPLYGMGIGHSYREESDVQAALRRLGFNIWLEPAMKIEHHYMTHGGQGGCIERNIFWFTFNHLLFIRKNLRMRWLRTFGHLLDIFGYALKYRSHKILFNGLRGWSKGIRWMTMKDKDIEKKRRLISEV